MTTDFREADQIAAGWFRASGGQPGLAYGIVADGKLVHSGGLGERRAGGPAPDAGTVFRIASMTKSFTAAAVLALRDDGVLALDDPAERYVPELAGVALPGPDCPPVTIRQLLTMTAGFPTDDPWGDRQQGLDTAEFAAMLARGDVRCAWAPGTRFEYSNLGYAVLGRVITAVTGEDYAAVVAARLLDPLGLTSTGYHAGEFEPGKLAAGYRRDAGGWAELAPDPYGAFAPMGGLFSTVADLARWVAGFAAAFPAGTAGGKDHPLSRAARREMQLAQVAIPGDAGIALRFSGPPRLSYGLGLFCEDDPQLGSVVQHSGGYPGFGSNMRWHPATGLGVVALGNATYAPAGQLAGRLLWHLVRAETGGRPANTSRILGPVPHPGGPWPETLTAREAADRLLASWDERAARALLAPNVGLDRPLAQRQADAATLRVRIGPFERDPGRPLEHDSPAHCRWWLTGPGGTVAAQIRLAPLRQPLVQQLSFAIPPAPGSALHHALVALAGLVTPAQATANWPQDVPAAAGLDTASVLRQLRVAGAWAGPAQIDSYLAGDGSSAVTVRLTGPDGQAELALAIDDASELTSAAVALGG